MKPVDLATMHPNGAIYIPKALRQAYGLSHEKTPTFAVTKDPDGTIRLTPTRVTYTTERLDMQEPSA